ncbi:Protein RKD4 [Glycine soja]|uniref:Protein RKD4 n=1 Tax=Glycine soja TaxID=3848 RepID=A0A445I729_GLYSO|nr:Protein RKD4 [Glycine soja]
MITKATADGTFNTRNKDMEQHATTKSYCKHRKLKSLQLLIDNVKEKGLEDEVARLEKHKRLLEKLPEMELSEKAKKLRQACFKANYKKMHFCCFFFLTGKGWK